MNPETNKFEPLLESFDQLLRPDGTPVPKHWSVFTAGEHVVVKDYTFWLLPDRDRVRGRGEADLSI